MKRTIVEEDDPPRLLSIRGAAELLAVSPASVRRLLLRGALRSVRTSPAGKVVRLLRDEVLAFVARRTARAVPPEPPHDAVPPSVFPGLGACKPPLRFEESPRDAQGPSDAA